MFAIPKEMQAVVYRGVNDLRLETLPVPRIGTNELLVKVAACGVCPTDIKKIHFGTVPPPRVFGHETAGTIVRIGARVRGFRLGERVALHHHIPCLKCHACRHRAFAQCAQYKRTGITAGFEPAGGGYAEYVRVMSFVLPGVVKIPHRNTFFEGAMLEPVNTVLKAVHRLTVLKADTVLVAGQGPIGLLFTRLLALRGINVIATDLLKPRLQLAKQWGAHWAFEAEKVGRVTPCAPSENLPVRENIPGRSKMVHPLLGERAGVRAKESPASLGANLTCETRDSSSLSAFGGEGRGEVPDCSIRGNSIENRKKASANPSSNLTAQINHLTHGRGLDAAIIAVPSDAAVLQAQELVRGAGQILLFAHTRRGVQTQVDLSSVCTDEKDLIGSYSADFTLQNEVSCLVFSRKLDVRSLITHQFPLAQTAAAIELAAHPQPESLKIMVIPGIP